MALSIFFVKQTPAYEILICDWSSDVCSSALHLTLAIVHFDYRLVWSCSAMENHFVKLLMCSSFADVASRGNLELFSE